MFVKAVLIAVKVALNVFKKFVNAVITVARNAQNVVTECAKIVVNAVKLAVKA